MGELVKIGAGEMYYPFQSAINTSKSPDGLCILGIKAHLQGTGVISPIIDTIFNPNGEPSRKLFRLAVDIKYADRDIYSNLVALAVLPNGTIFVAQDDNFGLENDSEAATFTQWKPLSQQLYDPAIPDVIITSKEITRTAIAFIRQPNQR